jgi:hypothetical protein
MENGTRKRHMANIVITVLVAIHLAVNLWHGNAHTELGIALPPGKNVFVIVVILIAPLIAAALLWTRYVLVGLWMFFLSMLGALLFGAYHHYILVSPDNIGHLAARRCGCSLDVHCQRRGTCPARIGFSTLWCVLSGVALGKVAWQVHLTAGKARAAGDARGVSGDGSGWPGS